MDGILDDKTKFIKKDEVNLHDSTVKNEQKLQKRFLDLVHQNVLARAVYDRIRLTGSRNYGLPKINKENVPLIPIYL